MNENSEQGPINNPSSSEGLCRGGALNLTPFILSEG